MKYTHEIGEITFPEDTTIAEAQETIASLDALIERIEAGEFAECDYCPDGKLTDMNTCPKCDAHYD